MFRNRRCSTVNHTSSIIAIIRIIAFFFLSFFSANQAEIQRVIFRDVGHAIPFRDHNLLSPFSFAISEITQRTLFSVYVCVCVCTLLSFFLSLSLPLRSPVPPLLFPLLFHLIHRAGNSNGMESFQAGRSGISSLCCDARSCVFQ